VTAGTEAVAAESFRQEWGRIVATLIRTTGDWELAEECVQDAFARALERWPRDGIPDRPGAWLTTTARHQALDRLRRRSTETAKLAQVAIMAQPGEPEPGEPGPGAPATAASPMTGCG
jgi:RNA polymerase sigma-70 factor (ECF subfamily)